MKTLAWTGVVMLALLGALGGVTRTIVVTRTLQGAPAAELSPEERENLRLVASAMGVHEGTERYRLLEQDTRDASLIYNSKPTAILLHVVPGTVFLLLAPVQLIARVRQRWPGLHRSSGYLLLVLAVSFGVTAFYIAVVDPFFDPSGSAAALLFGTLFINAGVRAFAAIRRGDVAQHRVWMLRFLAVAYGIAVMRALTFPLFALLDVTFRALAPPTIWAGWIISIVLAEWWIRRSPVQDITRAHARVA